MRKSLLIKKGVACLLSAAMVLSTPIVGSTKTASADDASQTPDITTGLVGHYTFEDSLANLAVTGDEAVAKVIGGAGDGNFGKEGTVDPLYVEGQHGKAYTFTGDTFNEEGDVSARGEGLELDVNTGRSFTISAWVKTEEKYDYQPIFFTNKDGDNYVTAGTYYNNFASGGIANYDTVWHWLDKNNNSASTLKDINKNEWTHIVLTFEDNGENKAAAKLYYNAEVLSSQPDIKGKDGSAYVTDSFKDMPIYLGVNWWNNSFKGLMDDVRVYNRALTDEDVVALYKEDSVSLTSAAITGGDTVSATKIYATQDDIDSDVAAASFESSTLELSSSFEPENATGVVTKWSVAEEDSAKAEIAENGTVTLTDAAKNGDTIKIIATLTDAAGNEKIAEKTITANVTQKVQDEDQKVTSIEIANMELSAEYVNKDGITNEYAPEVAYTPEDPLIKDITYTVKEGIDIAAVNGQKIVPLKAGTATVTAVSKSNPEVTKDFTVTVTEVQRPHDFTAVAFASAESGFEKLVGDFDITYSFHNKSNNGTTNWENFIFELTDGKGKWQTYRADYILASEVFGVAQFTGIDNWDNFVADMNKGANVTVRAVRAGDKLQVDYVIDVDDSETVYNVSIPGSAAVGKEVSETLYTHITGQNVEITNIALKYNAAGENFTCTPKDLVVGSDVTFKVTPDAGYSVKSVKYAGEALTADAEGNYKIPYNYIKGISALQIETETIPYSITEEGRAVFQNGTIDAVDTTKKYVVGDEITIVTTPKAGFTSNITVTYMEGTEKKTVELTKTVGEGGKEIVKFKMPAANVTISYAEFSGIIRDAIQAAIASAKPVMDAGNESGKYTTATWNTFKTAYEAAVAAEADTSASQADLDSAQKALEDAQKALAFSYKVELSDKEISLTVGDKKKLTASVTTEAADKNVTWTSSNENVASVNDGEVTAIAAGDTTITATAADGTSESCKVTVTAAGGNGGGTGTDDKKYEVITDSTAEGYSDVVEPDAWWGDFSNYYKVSGDFDVTFTIKQDSTPTANYNTPTMAMTSDADRNAEGYVEYLMRRTDSWCQGVNGKGDNQTGNGVEVTKVSEFNWDTFLADMTGATHDVNAKRTGNDFVITDKITKADGMVMADYVVSFTDAGIPSDLRMFWTGDAEKFTITSYKVNSASVTPPEENNVSLKLNKSKATLYTGKASNKTTVKATVTGTTKAVTWTSSKTKVATVSKSGNTVTIKAVGKGTTTITATVEGKKATLKVTVKNPTITVKNGKKKVGSSLTVKKKKAVKLTIATNPKKAGTTLAKLSKKNKKVLTASLKKGKLTIKGKKKGTVTLTIKSGKASKKIKVKVK